jgi:hypothetical protein
MILLFGSLGAARVELGRNLDRLRMELPDDGVAWPPANDMLNAVDLMTGSDDERGRIAPDRLVLADRQRDHLVAATPRAFADELEPEPSHLCRIAKTDGDVPYFLVRRPKQGLVPHKSLCPKHTIIFGTTRTPFEYVWGAKNSVRPEKSPICKLGR